MALNEKFNIKGLILSGGPSSVYEPNAPRIDPEILELNLPVLGLCYGHQLIAQIVKGKVEPAIMQGIRHRRSQHRQASRRIKWLKQ